MRPDSLVPILMPQVGENLATGTVLEWHVQVGEPVTRGETVLSVESEKAVFEIQAEADGVLAQVLVQAGDEGAVLEPVGYLDGEQADPSAPDSSAPSASVAPAATAAPPTPSAPTPTRPLASPAARRRARDLGVDLARIDGTGSGGRIIVRDVLAASEVGERSAPADQVVPFSRLRRHIAARTSLSSRTIPHLYLFADVDMTAALAHLETVGPEPGIGLTDLLIEALARALRQFPRLNGHVEGDSLTIKGSVNVGVATTAPDGMLLPVVADAGRKSLRDLAADRARNAAAVRRGVVSLGARATITLADLSGCDIYRILPLINPPECAVIGAGAVQERVVSHHREPAVRDVMSLSLGCDHRVVDAEYGARFLECLVTLLEQPPTPSKRQPLPPAPGVAGDAGHASEAPPHA